MKNKFISIILMALSLRNLCMKSRFGDKRFFKAISDDSYKLESDLEYMTVSLNPFNGKIYSIKPLGGPTLKIGSKLGDSVISGFDVDFEKASWIINVKSKKK